MISSTFHLGSTMEAKPLQTPMILQSSYVIETKSYARWRPSLLGWRPLLLGNKKLLVTKRLCVLLNPGDPLTLALARGGLVYVPNPHQRAQQLRWFALPSTTKLRRWRWTAVQRGYSHQKRRIPQETDQKQSRNSPILATCGSLAQTGSNMFIVWSGVSLARWLSCLPLFPGLMDSSPPRLPSVREGSPTQKKSGQT